MSIEEQAKTIRLLVTATIISEYQLRKLVDNTKHDLKARVRFAIASCLKVQDYFVTHQNTNPQTAAIFKQQFLGEEILLLGELLEACFGLSAESIEDVIKAVKQNTNDGVHNNS